MKLTLRPTDQIVTLHAGADEAVKIEARVWEGHDEQGFPVHAYISRVAVAESEPQEVHDRFSRELQDCPKPRPMAKVPLSIII